VGRQLAHAIRDCGIVGSVGETKQRFSLPDEKVRVQQSLPSQLQLRYYFATQE